MLRPLIRRAGLGAVTILLLTSPSAPLTAQQLPPTNVTVVASGTGVSVAWTPVRGKGITYRVLRGPSAKEPGTDITKPVGVGPVVDLNVTPGTTYFYQVIATYADGNSGAAAPVAFTLAAAPIAQPVVLPSGAVKVQPVGLAPIPAGTPTSLTPPSGAPPQGVIVTGSPSNAVLSWQLSPGATYSVSRWLQANPDCCRGASPGLPPTARGWEDDLSQTMPTATTYGIYIYRITANHKDGSQGYVDVSYNRQPPQKPLGFSARDAGGGTVAFQWQAVPGAIQYRLDGTGIPSAGQIANGTNVTVGGVPAGPGASWKIVALYPHNFADYTMASAASAVVRVLPPHSMPWLTKNNGPGSLAQTIAHYAPTQVGGQGSFPMISDAELAAVAGLSSFRSWIDGTPTPGFPHGQWDKEAVYGNNEDLGVGRRTACFQEMKGLPVPGLRTVCYAAAHGIPPGDPGFENQDTSRPGPGLSPGFLLAMMIIKDPAGTQFLVMTGQQFATGNHAIYPVNTARLDSEGGKLVPHVCLSCHGGRYNQATNRVDGASFLPLNPAMLAFGSAVELANQQDKIRRINLIMSNADPASPVAEYIRGLYNGAVAQAGTWPQTDYVPAGWSQQPGLYRQVVRPYCTMCHLAGPNSYNFTSYANFLANKALIYIAVCKAHTMPHAELPYKAFWTKDTGALYLPGLLAAALGYPSCS